MSESLTTTDKDISTPRRSVARRACLSCREKKIKCDGEDVSRVKNENAGDNNNQKPTICTNCKFLGTECVFVRSMRGGRRKRKVGSEQENAKSLKTETSHEDTTVDSTRSSNSRPSYSEHDSPPLSDNKSRFGPASPSSFYSVPLGNSGARSDESRREHIGDGHGHHYGYDYRHYPPQAHHFYPPPPGSHMMGYPPQPPPPLGHPPFSIT